ncbi:hypothetical protein GCM10011519_33680 [Marmoricola endophyticus]|uniref:Terminase n=1 Tax=Marmoricola endophyticus TaxID=2040280 RepID=A0A917BU79_9ACTN|nr:terminase [Marmoricola endophyticus]GGF56988.1 hypothetical protein GCM10011519_33680 [Marmoricola endophyticus]
MTETEEDTRPEPPADLGDAGRTYWLRVAEEFDLGAVEEPALAEVARTLDTLAALDAAVRRDGHVTDAGKVSPAVVEARQQRAILVRLLGLLDLPTDDDERPSAGGTGVSRAARKAARTRWGAANGRR